MDPTPTAASFDDRVKDAFLLATESPDPRAAADRACGDDADLRAAVVALLDAHEQAGGFLTGSAVLSPPLPAGDRIGLYTLVRVIGEGGFGTVYEARQERPLRRTVAVKVIKPGMDTRQVIARFEAERQALAVMDHPSIARVFDAGQTPAGRPYFVMERVDGVPINAYCDRERLSVAARLDLFAHVCQAVQHAHGKGVIHRDIKPGNVLVTVADGRPLAKVIDFGIAKAVDGTGVAGATFTDGPAFVGTPEYMSPEQAAGSPDVDTRTDVYGLGVLLYELLVGATPFDAKVLRARAMDEMRRVIRDTDPPKPSTRLLSMKDELGSIAACRQAVPARLAGSLRGELDWIVMRAMDKSRHRRYATADALAADVRAYLADEPVAAGPESAAYRFRKFARRRRGLVATAAVVLASLLVGLGAASYGLVRAVHERSRAEHERDRAEQARAAAAEAGEQSAEGGRLLDDMFASLDPQQTRGRPVLAREILDNAARRLDVSPPAHPLVEGSVRSVIGNAYSALGLYAEAEANLRRAVDLYRRARATADPVYAFSLSALGEALGQRNRLTGAKRALDEALPLQESLTGLSSVEAATVRATRADVLGRMGQWDAAVAEQTAATVAIERALGPDHFRTLLQRQRLARMRASRGDLPGAEADLRRVLDRELRALGEDHPQTIMTLINLAVVLGREHEADEAIATARRAVALSRRVFGADHQHTIEATEALACDLFDAGQVAEADRAYADLFPRMRATLGDDHELSLEAHVKHADRVAGVGRWAEAEVELRDAAARADREFGPADETTIRARGTLAWVLTLTGHMAESIAVSRDLLPVAERSMGADHPYVATLRTEAGTAMSRSGDFEGAEPLLRRAYEDARAQGRTGRVGSFAQGYGWCLANLGRWADATPVLLDADRAFRSRGSPGRMDLYVIADALSVCYDRLDRPAEAAQWREKRDAAGPVRWPANIARRIHPPTPTPAPATRPAKRTGG